MKAQNRYTLEEFARMKKVGATAFDFGRKHIIGQYTFKHDAFGGKVARFTRNSFKENLRYGEGFEDKVAILMAINSLLQSATYDRYVVNLKSERKPDVDGYFVFKGEHSTNDVEYLFEKRKDGSILFHFIKLHKK